MKNNNIKHFDKTTNKMTLEQKFDYIKKHFKYYTMSSWNRLESIANNVKIHNLPLTKEEYNKFYDIYCDDALSEELYSILHQLIDDWEQEHNNIYDIYFNGRSGGYLVITSKKNNNNIIDDYILDNISYKEAIKDYQDRYRCIYSEAQSYIKYIINRDFEIVQSFDRLCDDLLNNLKYILNNSQIVEQEEERTVIVKTKFLNII